MILESCSMNNKMYIPKIKKHIFRLITISIPIIFLILIEVTIRSCAGEKLKIQPITFDLYTPKYYTMFGHPIPIPDKTKNEYRIILLGGSTAAGFPKEQFEQKLNRYAKLNNVNRKFSFYNLAWPSYQSTQEFIQLYQHALDAKPDFIITMHGTNDFSIVINHDYEPGEPVYFENFKNLLIFGGFISEIKFNYILHNILLRYSYIYRQMSFTFSKIAGDKDSGLKMKCNRLFHYKKSKNYDTSMREKILKLYSKNIDVMAALTNHYKIKFLASIQPMFFGKNILSDSEREKKIRSVKEYEKIKNDKNPIVEVKEDLNIALSDEFEIVFNQFYNILAQYKKKHVNKTFYYENFSYLFYNIKDTIFSDSCHFAPNFTKDNIAKGYAPIMAIYFRYIMSDVTGINKYKIPIDVFDDWTSKIV